MSYKNKQTLSNIIQYVVIIATIAIFIVGLCAIPQLFEIKDGYDTAKFTYAQGQIVSDSTGSGVVEESNNSLYSKESLTCTGFVIKTDFNTRVDYEIHYYTADNKYIGYEVVTDENYSVDVGHMPYLKSYVGDIDSEGYDDAAFVLDDNDHQCVATQIRSVIRPLGATDDIFSGISGWAAKLRFANALTVRYTVKAV